MKASQSPKRLTLSATDLSGFNECAHKTVLDLAVAFGELARPGENEIERLMLEKRGFEHEARVLARLQATHEDVIKIDAGPGEASREAAARATEAEMTRGAQVIAQGVLTRGNWFGRPDFLLKQAGKSRFGEHRYAVLDAKLANEAKARAVLQLCAYTDLLSELQQAEPEFLYIAPGGTTVNILPLRTADYLSYYRLAKARFAAFVEPGAERAVYPEPVEHCAVCGFWKRCEDRRRADDHLSLVAGITARQRDRLRLARVMRVTELGALDLAERVAGISPDALERVREQARLQVAARGEAKPRYELLLDVEPTFGLDRLPLPKPGDLFLDLEGDPFVQNSGLDYLFGLLELGQIVDDFVPRSEPGAPRYHAFWAKNLAQEKRAFEAVIDRILQGREEFADLHVFHFGHREADAVRKLSCRHKTREAEIDQLLREHVFVDLHGIVKRSVRASVESYTLKQLEGLYDFERRVDLRRAARAMQLFGWLLETGEGSAAEAELCADIERYNEEDCQSTYRLRAWLEARRGEFEQKTGQILARPEKPKPPPLGAEQHESAVLAKQLLHGLPEDPALDEPEQAAKRLMSNLLGYHWREEKQTWWEHFRARELPPAERREDRSVLADLRFVAVIGSEGRSKLLRYEFPEQEYSSAIKPGSKSSFDPDSGKSAGAIVQMGEGFIVLKRSSESGHPRALIPPGPIATTGQAARLLALGRAIAQGGFGVQGEFAAARELLLRHAPRCGQAPGAPLIAEGEDTVLGIQRLALALDRSVLSVQGPPGSGKTFRAAEMIVALVRAGKRIGVTSNSHRVIKQVLALAAERLAQTVEAGRVLHIGDESASDELEPAPFELSKDYPKIRQRLDARELDVVGGTSWAWANEHMQRSVEVLVVDEASQMSLANVLAISSAAESLVLFGDPAQLDQPQKGTHPPGAGASALEHLLGDALTMPPELGVFLPETRRLCPKICEFTSRVFYEGRLEPFAGLERQAILGTAPFTGSGLCFAPVSHTGNTNQSDEEVECVREIVTRLFDAETRFVDSGGTARRLEPKDVLVVAPYNAQVAALRAKLPPLVEVGTVDKFQGMEAPIVIYSMTTSSAEDAPRGMEFLYSLNRLNVATSRAQALVVLVANPTLVNARCKTPRQMQLANALCAYLERAERWQR
ncbi:MAG TPA: TM0106 family RecB-like putative nuclease [Polyangiaceae bacterium]|nr:TM0106 family RecB-like putative nuclease [Polyangiaceae bacterium]